MDSHTYAFKRSLTKKNTVFYGSSICTFAHSFDFKTFIKKRNLNGLNEMCELVFKERDNKYKKTFQLPNDYNLLFAMLYIEYRQRHWGGSVTTEFDRNYVEAILMKMLLIKSKGRLWD